MRKSTFCPCLKWPSFLKYVNKKTIIIFAITDICCMCTIAFFFCHFDQIDDVGWLLMDWKWFFSFAIFRVACGPLGIFAALNSKIKTMQTYWSFLFVHLVFAGLLTAPFYRLQCKCSNFRQCVALSTFTREHIVNPWPEPNKQKYAVRRVPYHDPPEMPAKAAVANNLNLFVSSFTKGLDLEGKQPRESVARVSSNLQVSSHSTAYVSHRRALASADGNNTVIEYIGESDDSFLETGSLQVRGPPKKSKLASDHSGAHSPKKKRSDEMYKRRHEKADGSLLKYFNFTDPGIRWESELQRDCVGLSFNGGAGRSFANHVARAMMALATGNTRNIEQDDFLDYWNMLVDELWVCSMTDSCGVLEASWNFVPEEDKSILSVCRHDHPVIPQLGPGKGEDSLFENWPETWEEALELMHDKRSHYLKVGATVPGINFTIWLQKDLIATRDDRMLSLRLQEHHIRSWTQQNTKKGDEDSFATKCVCDRIDNCMAYQPGYSNVAPVKYWCYVDEVNLKACYKQGYNLYRDKLTLRWWTDEICEHAGCNCSKLGMLPYPGDNVNKAKLNTTGMNYGSRCDYWDHGNKIEWCFVGFDSTCNDRELSSASSVMDSDSVHWDQYYSSLPCIQKAQNEILEGRARNNCLTVRFLGLIILVGINAVTIPFIAVIFQFIRNRCGDEFQGGNQFETVFSSDEESEDMFNVEDADIPGLEGSDKRKKKKHAKKDRKGKSAQAKADIASTRVPDSVPADDSFVSSVPSGLNTPSFDVGDDDDDLR